MVKIFPTTFWTLITVLLCGLSVYKVQGQGCIYPPSQRFFKVKETDLPGTLAEFDAQLPREVWTLSNVPVVGYLELQRENDTIRLVTLKSLDLEEMREAVPTVSTRLKVTLSCTYDGIPPVPQEVNIIITPINEYDPYFENVSYKQDIEENSAIGTTVFTLDGLANDWDFLPQQNPISQFRLFDVRPEVPVTYFSMVSTTKGIITTQEPLDYEALAKRGLTSFTLNVSAEDNGDPGPRSAFTTITVNIIDVDDENPAFVYDCECTNIDCPPQIKGLCEVPAYYTTITPTSSGALSVRPSAIFAVDGDMLNYTIAYSIVAGSLHNHSLYFTINEQTGVVTQTRQLDTLDIDSFVLTIQATEVSTAQRQAIRGLTISVYGQNPDRPPFPTDTTPYSNGTEPALSATKEDDDSIALWVLLVAIGSCLLLGVLVALGVFIFLRKRHKSDVHPDDTQSSGPSNVSTEEEILDAYASETTENKWGASNLDLSVRSAYVPTGTFPHSTFKSDTNASTYMNGHMTSRGNLSPRPFDLVVPLGHGNGLPPLNKADMVDTSTETEETDIRKMKRKPKKKKTKEEEIYDGTRSYEMEADPSFFTGVRKQKVKRNPRSFNFKNAPDHWITVPNDF